MDPSTVPDPVDDSASPSSDAPTPAPRAGDEPTVGPPPGREDEPPPAPAEPPVQSDEAPETRAENELSSEPVEPPAAESVVEPLVEPSSTAPEPALHDEPAELAAAGSTVVGGSNATLSEASAYEPPPDAAEVEADDATQPGASHHAGDQFSSPDLPTSANLAPPLGEDAAPAPATAAEIDPDELAREYSETLRRFQNLAERRKAIYQGCWMVATGLTWATLILAVVSISIPGADWWHSMVLQTVLPSMGVIVSIITITQSTLGMQGRWLAARGAAEELKHDAMRFRLGLPPYNGDDASEVLHQRISLVRELSHRAKSANFHERFRWGYFYDLLTRLPPRDEEHRSLADEGVFPRFHGTAADAAAVLDGRLRHQRRWYLRKARGYARMFITFQLTVVSISMANAIYVFMFGRRFELVALSTALSLGIMTYRDFFDYGPTFFRYVQAAGNLREIEEAYLAGDAPFDEGDDEERLRRLVHYVEETIAHEFLAWQASRR